MKISGFGPLEHVNPSVLLMVTLRCLGTLFLGHLPVFVSNLESSYNCVLVLSEIDLIWIVTIKCT